jgi:PHD-finger
MECIKCKVSDNDAIIQCDGCNRYIHTECSELNASELKVMGLKGKRLLKFYCEDCTFGVRLVPELIKKVDDLQREIMQLAAQSKNNGCSTFTEDVVIAKIQERYRRSKNVVMFNLLEMRNGDLNSVKEVVRTITNEDPNIEKIPSEIWKKQ